MLIFIFLLNFYILNCQDIYFPPKFSNDWETINYQSLGWNESQINDLYDFLEEKNTKSFMVLKDGKIVLEKYFGTFVQDSLWYWASAGKGLTSVLIGMAEEQNFLSLSDKTSKYLGESWTNCLKEQEDKITIWNQLSMTSGLDDIKGDPYCTIDTCLNYKADAGERWAYHNAPYTLLDGVLENASGKNLNQFFTQNLQLR